MSDAVNEKLIRLEPEPFVGPLFLVGMPRSGTKLLRGMLGQHRRIRFSDVETEFFPYWVANWHQFTPLENRQRFDHFYLHCMKLPFFIQNAERGIVIARDEWFSRCQEFTPPAVFDAMMRIVLAIEPHDRTTIWGDKSPSYITHVPLLLEHFPEARVVHIVRDVRDYCLSIHKAWGKSMIRAAHRWQEDVSKCRSAGKYFSRSYMEIRFEDILLDPITSLIGVCRFIGLEFEEEMLKLESTVENIGDAKGSTSVLSNNAGKYKGSMGQETVSQIEVLACTNLREMGYPCAYNGRQMRLNSWRLRMLQLADGLGLLKATVAERGIIGAIKFQIDYFRTSGNRTF